MTTRDNLPDQKKTDLVVPPPSTGSAIAPWSPKRYLPAGLGIAASGALYLMSFHLLGEIGLGVSLVAFAVRLAGALRGSATNGGPAVGDEESAAKAIRRALNKAQYLDSVDAGLATRALDQYDRTVARRVSFQHLLEDKFETTELAFDRYLGAADQVCDAVLVNLKTVSQLLEIREKTNDMETLLAHNETFLTELDKVLSAVSDIKTSKSGGTVDTETVLGDLHELAQRAKKYSL